MATGEEVGRGKIQEGCRRRGMMRNHTPKDRDATAWQECSLAWRGPYRVMVRRGSSL
jgi:hypothetical protein